MDIHAFVNELITCLCQKRHTNILNMLPCFDLMCSAASWPGEKRGIALKTLFNIVEERFKQLLSFDVSAV